VASRPQYCRSSIREDPSRFRYGPDFAVLSTVDNARHSDLHGPNTTLSLTVGEGKGACLDTKRASSGVPKADEVGANRRRQEYFDPAMMRTVEKKTRSRSCRYYSLWQRKKERFQSPRDTELSEKPGFSPY